MDNEFIDSLEEWLDKLDNAMYNNTKNSLEKINIVTKTEELVFWLEQYRQNILRGE